MHSIHPRCIFQQQTSSSMPTPSPFRGLAQPGASSAPLCHLSSPGQALDRTCHAQEINPAGCRPVTSRAGGQERLPEALMRLEIKSWSGGVPVPRRVLAATPLMAPARQSHPRCPRQGRRAESERRGRKEPLEAAVFFTKYTNFKCVTIIYKTRELQNVRNCPVCTRIEKCPVLEQGRLAGLPGPALCPPHPEGVAGHPVPGGFSNVAVATGKLPRERMG